MTAVATLRAADPDDATLIRSIAAGELSSLGLLFQRHVADVHRFVARLGVRVGDVDDVVQATFLLVLDAAPSFRASGTVRSWLFGLAANLVRSRRRSLARLAHKLIAWTTEREFEAPPRSPEDATATQQRGAIATRALLQLSAKKREVFVMIVMEGLLAEEVATALQLPIGTVWTRLHHARRELRERLEREGAL